MVARSSYRKTSKVNAAKADHKGTARSTRGTQGGGGGGML